jgi:hypothetical protein
LLAGACLGLLLALLGCMPVEVEPTLLPPTETPTATSTSTPTIVWFPATATPTALPTEVRTPTPELKPGLGAVLVEDDFSDEDAWVIREIENGRVSLPDNHITLALNQPDGFIYAYRVEPLLTDFYAEITANPNLCQREDEYGLMVRVGGLRLDHYRLAVSCSGQARALRVINNRGNAIQDWETRPYIPVNFPSQSKLGVWMQGANLRFFVNDRLVYELTDAVIKQGSFGLYVFGGGGGSISVNFSDLLIYELESEE